MAVDKGGKQSVEQKEAVDPNQKIADKQKVQLMDKKACVNRH